MKLRFAPSPTGLLHVGNARLALANALFARRNKGKFQLRIDDTDTARSREELVGAIQQDLEWMGITWDETFRQTERLDRYAAAIEKLKASGHLYPCFESEQELAAKRETQIRQRRAPVYDRAMLRMTEQQRAQAEANGKVPYWRFKLSGRIVRWRDLVMGDCHVKLPSVSDPVLVRTMVRFCIRWPRLWMIWKQGSATLSVGEDHVTNTGVQIDIAEALGARPDHFRFAHLPLLLDENGGKLSKRFDACSLRTLRQDGVEGEALISYLARLGSSDDPALMPFDALAQSYDLSHISRSAARFDTRQLLAMNHRHLAQLPFAAVAEKLPKGATEAFWLAIRSNIDLLSEAKLWLSVVEGDIIPPVQEEDEAFLKDAAALLPPEPWDEGTWKAWTAAIKDQTGRSGKALFHPLRVALTGEEHGPELRDLLPLIGRKRALGRLLPSLI